MKAVAEASPETVRARLEWLMHDPKRVTDDLVELRLRIYTQPGFVRAMEHILCLQNMDIRMRNVLTDEALSRISASTLVIWTDHDPTAPVVTGERFVRAAMGKGRSLQRATYRLPDWACGGGCRCCGLTCGARHDCPADLCVAHTTYGSR
jgi:hypothetical protein